MGECAVCKTECGTRRYCDDECLGYAQGREQGERETIARVVKWLRAEAAKHSAPMPGVDPVGSVLVIADAIEQGEWRSDE